MVFGPDKLSKHERRQVNARASDLDCLLEGIEQDAGGLCGRVTGVTHEFRDVLDECFSQHGLRELVHPFVREYAFCSERLDMVFMKMDGIVSYDEETALKLHKEELFKGQAKIDVDSVIDEYVRTAEPMLEELDYLGSQYMRHSLELRSLISFERPLGQRKLRRSALFYVSCFEDDHLFVSRGDLLSARFTSPEPSGLRKFDRLAYEDGMVMRMTAREDDTVYLVRCPGSRLSAEDGVREVMLHLAAKYAHVRIDDCPSPVMEEERGGDILWPLPVKSYVKPVVITDDRGRSFAWADGEVPDSIIEKLMRGPDKKHNPYGVYH